MIIAVDVGNTRLKWAAHPGDIPVAGRFVAAGELLHAGATTSTGDADAIGSLALRWSQFTRLQRIVVCSVAGSIVLQALAEVAARLSVPIDPVVAQPACAGVRNLYAEPARLGADRWAGLLGARARSRGAVLVVDAGTAMTVDALAADGRFLGGLIVPGFELMRLALARGTACLPFEDGAFTGFPRATPDAIVSGTLQAMAGAVLRMRSTMMADGQAEPLLMLTGGDAGRLQQLLSEYAPLMAPQLVLEGLLAAALHEGAGHPDLAEDTS